LEVWIRAIRPSFPNDARILVALGGGAGNTPHRVPAAHTIVSAAAWLPASAEAVRVHCLTVQTVTHFPAGNCQQPDAPVCPQSARHEITQRPPTVPPPHTRAFSSHRATLHYLPRVWHIRHSPAPWCVAACEIRWCAPLCTQPAATRAKRRSVTHTVSQTNVTSDGRPRVCSCRPRSTH